MYFYSGVSNYRETPYIISDDYANIGNYAATIKGSVYIARDGASLSVASIYQANGTSWVAIGSSVTAAASSLQAVTTVGNTTNLGIVISANGLNSTGNSNFTANVTSGTPNTFTSNQTATNLTDTGDGSVVINNALTGTGTTNEEVLRALTIGNSNQRTGGTVLVNSRAISTISSTLASTTTTNLDQIYLDYDTAAGTVTNGRGVTIKRMYGTSQAAFVTSLLTSTNRSHLFIGGYTLPSGAWGIYSSVTDSSSFLGKMIIGTNTDDTVNNLQLKGTEKITGLTAFTAYNTTPSGFVFNAVSSTSQHAMTIWNNGAVGIGVNASGASLVNGYGLYVDNGSNSPSYLAALTTRTITVTTGSNYQLILNNETEFINGNWQGRIGLSTANNSPFTGYKINDVYLNSMSAFGTYNDVVIGGTLGPIIRAFGITQNVGINSNTDIASAQLHISSTTKGFLQPRMTNTQILAIATPSNGLEVYNTDLAQPCFYDGTGWRKISHSAM